jgi:hypothetical protein
VAVEEQEDTVVPVALVVLESLTKMVDGQVVQEQLVQV